MPEKNPAEYSAEDLAAPDVSAETLAAVAAVRPELWDAILAHPLCYPGLRDWIGQQRQAAPAPPVVPVTAEAWSAAFTQQNGREATMSEYQAAVADGRIAADKKAMDPSLQQIGEGAKQFAAGAKDFITNKMAPAASEAARNVQHSVGQSVSSAQGSGGWRAWLPLVLPGSAVVGAIALLFPAGGTKALGLSITASFFGKGSGGTGWWMLILMLAVLGLSIAYLVNKQNWARLASRIGGIVVGAIGLFLAIGIMVSINDSMYSSVVSVGFGTILLLIASLVMLASAILALIPAKPATPGTPGSPETPTA